MSDPTLRDVMEMLRQLRDEMATKNDLAALRDETKNDLAALRSEMATKNDLAAARDETKNDLAALRNEMATKDGLSALETKLGTLEAKVDAHRAETAKGFAELDVELSRHADTVHRELEEEVAALKKQLATRPAPRRPRRAQ